MKKKLNRNVSIVHMCIVHVCRIHIDFLCSPEAGGGGVGLRCTVYMHMEKFLPLYSRGFARSVSEHTFILMIDKMCTVP